MSGLHDDIMRLPCNVPGKDMRRDAAYRIGHRDARHAAAELAAATVADYESVLADNRRLVRELDVLLNGEAGAAQQATLGDIVAQVAAERRRAAAEPDRDELTARFEHWVPSRPTLIGKLPLEKHPNGAYKDTRTYCVFFGWVSHAEHGGYLPPITTTGAPE